MRLEEKCPCGGEVAVTYDAGERRYSQPPEIVEARKQLETFRRAHKPCLKRLGEPATVAETSP